MKSDKLVMRLSLFLVVTLFIVKGGTAFFTNSVSFFAELSDSILDFLVVTITFIALRESKKPADSRHMYGHYKINSAAGLLQSILIIGLYCGILIKSIMTLTQVKDYRIENSVLAIITLIFSFILSLTVSIIVVKIGKETKNQAIIAQGINFRGDYFRSGAVIIGLLFSLFELYIVDLIVAMAVSIWAIIEGIKVLITSFKELIDTNAISDEIVDNMRVRISKLFGVITLDNLQILTVGNRLEAIVNVSVENDCLVKRTARLSSQIQNLISVMCPEYICEVTVTYNRKNLLEQNSLLKEIRDIVQNLTNKYQVHNLVLEQFKDRILVQYHILVDSRLSLGEAHQISEELEKRIHVSIAQENISDLEIEILSHIEPQELKDTVHNHNLQLSKDDLMRTQIIKIIESHPEICGYENFDILFDGENLDIHVKLLLAWDETLRKAHSIADLVEKSILRQFPQIGKIFIHTEPCEKKNT